MTQTSWTKPILYGTVAGSLLLAVYFIILSGNTHKALAWSGDPPGGTIAAAYCSSSPSPSGSERSSFASAALAASPRARFVGSVSDSPADATWVMRSAASASGVAAAVSTLDLYPVRRFDNLGVKSRGV